MCNPVKESFGQVAEVASDTGSYLKGGHERAKRDFGPAFAFYAGLVVFVMTLLSRGESWIAAFWGVFLAGATVWYLSYVLRGPRCTSTGT